MSEVKYKYLPKYTYDDYKLWEGKWELINGIPYAMSPSPVFKHQKISGKIHYQLEQLLSKCKKCQALLPIDWRIAGKDDDNVLQPDNLVICNEVKGDYLTETPEMIFEILSPSTALKDRHIKYEIYETQRVKYYIIVNIDSKIAEVFELKNEKFEKTIDAKDDVIKFELDSDCIIDFNFSEIWV
ncbi:MAG: Uma2 family endonuclease [Bacteroidota bacterium]|nr:Uma2 family endonuclease [Bacteroidota bacterium]